MPKEFTERRKSSSSICAPLVNIELLPFKEILEYAGNTMDKLKKSCTLSTCFISIPFAWWQHIMQIHFKMY